jgi:hypothetical protein
MVRDLAASFGSIGWQSEPVSKYGLVAGSTRQGDVDIGKSLYARW